MGKDESWFRRVSTLPFYIQSDFDRVRDTLEIFGVNYCFIEVFSLERLHKVGNPNILRV